MTRPAFALALPWLPPRLPWAEDSNLRAALSVLPDTAFSPQSARRLCGMSICRPLLRPTGGALDREALARVLLGGGIRPVEALAVGAPGKLCQKVRDRQCRIGICGRDGTAAERSLGLGFQPGRSGSNGVFQLDRP